MSKRRRSIGLLVRFSDTTSMMIKHWSWLFKRSYVLVITQVLPSSGLLSWVRRSLTTLLDSDVFCLIWSSSAFSISLIPLQSRTCRRWWASSILYRISSFTAWWKSRRSSISCISLSSMVTPYEYAISLTVGHTENEGTICVLAFSISSCVSFGSL